MAALLRRFTSYVSAVYVKLKIRTKLLLVAAELFSDVNYAAIGPCNLIVKMMFLMLHLRLGKRAVTCRVETVH
jgi:hypothetical protein